MLSKLLDDEVLEVRPVVWRRSLAAPVKSSSSRNGKPPDELTQLRARLAEFNTIAEQQTRQAYEAGTRAGEAAARQNLEGDVHAMVEKLAATIGEVAATRGDTIRRAEADTVKLAIEIARRVLHREVSVDTSALEGLIKAALEKLQAQEVYRVRVHPDQEAVVRTCLEQMGRSSAIEVIGDPLQAKGGAIFEISRGALDASVDMQLSEIERGLIDQLEARV
jgi:flagellar assembly protein FliH